MNLIYLPIDPVYDTSPSLRDTILTPVHSNNSNTLSCNNINLTSNYSFTTKIK